MISGFQELNQIAKITGDFKRGGKGSSDLIEQILIPKGGLISTSIPNAQMKSTVKEVSQGVKEQSLLGAST